MSTLAELKELRDHKMSIVYNMVDQNGTWAEIDYLNETIAEKERLLACEQEIESQ